jgi:thymidylate kinase
LRRRHAEAASPDLFENLATQRKVAKGYQRALVSPEQRAVLGPITVLDGTGSIGSVADAIERVLARRFKLERPAARRPAR